MRGATAGDKLDPDTLKISIHAPRAGRDEGGYRGLAIYFTFQSTRPVRGATCKELDELIRKGISIHAPRAGRDTSRGPMNTF